jgi:hypothetical protein
VLFVDEAAQMPLANVLAISHAGASLVLLGDPRQLEQPMKGSHPPGADASALDHLLGGQQTIHGDRGLFLEETWRLHPKICSFTSEMFYESRLKPRPGLESQCIVTRGSVQGSGLRLLQCAIQATKTPRPRRPTALPGLSVGCSISVLSGWTKMETRNPSRSETY